MAAGRQCVTGKVRMRQLRSKWPYLVLALLLCYTVLSLVPPSVWVDNIAAVALFLGIIAVTLLGYFRWLRGRLHFLRNWPTPATNARIRRILSLADFSPKTARTPKQIALSLVVIPLIVVPFPLASIAVTLFDSNLDGLPEKAARLGVLTLLASLLLGPVFHGLVFRLRTKYDLRNAHLSLLMYLPITIFVLTAWLHLAQFFFVDDRDFLTISLFDMFIPSYFGALMCVLTVLLYRVGTSPAPAPALTTHRLYRLTEVVTLLASLTGLAVILMLAL